MSIESSVIRRQIITQRYIATLRNKYYRQLRHIYSDIQDMLRRNPSATRLLIIRDDIEQLLIEATKQMQLDFVDDLDQIAQDELTFMSKAVEQNTNIALTIPKYEDLRAAILGSDLEVELAGSKKTIAEALQEFSEAQVRKVKRAIFEGLQTGSNGREIAKEIAHILQTTTRANNEAITRTLVNHTTARTRAAYVKNYPDVFQMERWNAVLDSRTTPICSGLDGKEWPVGEGRYPPAHWNCRSVRLPVINPEFRKGRPFKEKQTFGEWLGDQDDAFIDEYFSKYRNGKAKAELFKRGELSIDQFTDGTGREYTIAELQTLYGVSIDVG